MNGISKLRIIPNNGEKVWALRFRKREVLMYICFDIALIFPDIKEKYSRCYHLAIIY